jgi:hypothetical protein
VAEGVNCDKKFLFSVGWSIFCHAGDAKYCETRDNRKSSGIVALPFQVARIQFHLASYMLQCMKLAVDETFVSGALQKFWTLQSSI